jgi:hypothetical protein
MASAALTAAMENQPMIDGRASDGFDALGVTYDDRFWDQVGTLERVARAGSHEIQTIMFEDAPLWALVARAIETQKYASFMGEARIKMRNGFRYGPEEIRALASEPDRWTEPHPIRVPP